MYKGIYEILENREIAHSIFEMILAGDTSSISNPGQFINIKIDDCYLRRPISICDYDEKNIKIIYKIVGKGTKLLSEMCKGEKLDILSGLGNGYNTDVASGKVLVAGGGVGTPPLYNLTKKLVMNKTIPTVILGFASKQDSFYIDKFEALGVEIRVATMDGSLGVKGVITDLLNENEKFDYFYACGPMIMLKALSRILTANGQLSLEERMGCGFGACMGCSIKTKNGNKRVCKEGPVFEKDEIIW